MINDNLQLLQPDKSGLDTGYTNTHAMPTVCAAADAADNTAPSEQTPLTKSVFLAKDGGFTSVGVAVALLLVLALLFTSAQVHWLQSNSADIQYVADAGALAGGNVVGEYIVVARIADAVVLSISLFGMIVFGVAIVVSCIPYFQGVGVKMMDFGRQVFEARDKCANSAATALNNLQKALPFLAAVNAAGVIEANSQISATTINYRGLAITLPLAGEDIAFASDDAAQSGSQDVASQNTQTAELTDEAQDAYKQMQSSKLEAFLADCGDAPGYCQYERAAKLAGLSGGSNPQFSSVDSWLFDYAFNRAKAYYSKRLSIEAPQKNTLDEKVNSFARQRFFTFAVAQMNRGWCRTAADGTLDAYFPTLPKNTDEMRQTTLYTEAVYPSSADGVLHGSPECPDYIENGAAGFGSAAQLENGSFAKCGLCGFAASTIGKVGAASSTISNGFEYHYRIIAAAAERYKNAAKDYLEQTQKAQDSAEKSLDLFEQAMQALKTPRLTIKPPGRNGVIAIVVDTSAHSIPAGFTNSAVESDAELQPRVAISASVLAEEQADEGANILANFLDKSKADLQSQGANTAALGVFDGILEIWGSALLVYSQGGDAISNGLSDFLNSIPIVKSTPLASWAKRALNEIVQDLGLQGANLNTPKPILINTYHVLKASDSAAAKGLLEAKRTYSTLPGSGSGTLGSSLFDGLLGEIQNRGSAALEAEYTIFEISFGDIPGLPKIPVKVTLPEQITERGKGLLSELRQSLSNSFGKGGNNAVWE